MIRISLRDLQWRRRRFVIVVLVAALAFGLALTMTGLSNHLTQEGHRTVDLFGADQWVVADGVSGPFTSTQLIDERVVEQIRSTPGVTAAAPLLIGRTTIGRKDVNIIGYDPSSSFLPRKVVRAIERAGNRRGVIADTSLDRRVGQSIELGGSSLRIVATVSGTSFNFGAPTIFLPLGPLQRLLFAGEQVTSTVMVRGAVDLARIRGLRVPLDVITNRAVRADFDRLLSSTNDTIGIVTILLWLMATGIVAAILFVSVLERTRDFATLKAMGTTNRVLLGGLVLQAAVVSLASAVASIAVAKAVSPTFQFPVEIPSAAYIQLLAIALIVGVVSSLAGVRKITRIDPALAFGGAS